MTNNAICAKTNVQYDFDNHDFVQLTNSRYNGQQLLQEVTSFMQILG